MIKRLKMIAALTIMMAACALKTAAQENRWPLPLSIYNELLWHKMSNYDTQTGVELLINRDYTPAVSYLQRAAKRGDGYAMAILGDMYAKGLGVKKDMTISTNMFNKAIAAGNPLAHCYRGEIYYKNGKKTEAMSHFKKASDKNYTYGHFLMAAYSWLDKNYALSMEYMEKIAENGELKIKGLVGMIYAQGTVVEQDNAKAFKYLIEENMDYYQNDQLMELAKMYYEGRGTGNDVKHMPNKKYDVWFYKKGVDGRGSITDALIVLDYLVEKGYEPAQIMRPTVKKEYETRNYEYKKTTCPQFGRAVTQYIRNYREPQRPAIASAGRGEIVITARISSAGYVSGAQIKYRVLQRLDNDALNLVRNMPQWTPGTRGGFPADMNVEIGVSYFPLKVRLMKYAPVR